MDFLSLIDRISHLENQWPMDDVDVLFKEVFMFMYGFVMIRDETDEFR